MRTRLVLTANNIDLDRSIGHTLLFLGLRLIDNLLGNEDLLDNLPSGGYIVVQKNTGRKAQPMNSMKKDMMMAVVFTV